jgi:membrane-bound serine protease (ClpP class)
MKAKKLINLMLLAGIVLPLLFGFQSIAKAQSTAPEVVVVTLQGPLTPVWEGVLRRAIDQSVKQDAQVLIIELNTPGGSIDLMNRLIQQILASPTPVVVYVSPRGSMAASAGTLLVLAGQFAAMTPESAIGAASPVGSQGEDLTTTEAVKTKEILKASLRSLVARRGEAAIKLAESAIDTAKAASSKEALSAGLIDIIATDLPDLLLQLDGKSVNLNGTSVALDLKQPLVTPVEQTFVEGILGLLTNPNIVFLLLSIGVQALLIELSSPGGWVAGFFGAVLLTLSIYGLGILPVNWFGIIFLVIAFVLFILDIKAPTHGALTAAGTGSFIAGALVLFNSARVPSFSNVSVPLVIGMGLVIGLTFFAVVMIAVRAMKAPVITGSESLQGKTGISVTALNPGGIVQVGGEQWSALAAEGDAPIEKGTRVVVIKIKGVKLIVKRE